MEFTYSYTVGPHAYHLTFFCSMGTKVVFVLVNELYIFRGGKSAASDWIGCCHSGWRTPVAMVRRANASSNWVSKR